MINYNDSLKFDDCILFFCNDNCYPCEILEGILNNLDTKIYKINIQQYLEVAQNFDVTSIPTLIFMKNGKKVFQTSGVRNLKDINKILTHYDIK